LSELELAVERLVNRVSHWTPPRWAASSASGDGSRADVMYALVQRVAELAADAEGQPRRRVPRLDHDLALPDQLRVVARDLAATGEPAAIREATDLIRATDP
jgi:hypothetical protein